MSNERFTLLELCALSYYGKDASGADAIIPQPPGLTPKQELDLFRAYRRNKCPRARELLVRQYLCWAFKLANKMTGPRLSIDDAVSAANAGLMEALDSFKPGRKVKFVVFSYMAIRRHLIDALVATYPVEITTHMRKKMKEVEASAEKSAQAAARGEPVSLEEMFDRLGGTSEFQFDQLIERQEDAPFMPSETISPNDAAMRDDLSDALRRAVDTELDPIERAVIIGRHYRRDGKVLAFEQIGRQIGQPKNRVRRAYQTALQKLRSKLA